MKKTFLLATSFLLLSLSSTAYAGYKVAYNQNGETRCYNSDRYGTAYGYPVDWSYCTAGFISADSYDTATGAYRGRECFRHDQTGRIFGFSIADFYCATNHYRAGLSINGDYRCYNMDKKNNVYGQAVADHFCNP